MRDRLIELLEDCGRSQMPMVAGLELWADAIADYLLENNVVVMPRKNDPWIIVKNLSVEEALAEVANGT